MIKEIKIVKWVLPKRSYTMIGDRMKRVIIGAIRRDPIDLIVFIRKFYILFTTKKKIIN
jgi:hypothetical protein